MEIIKDKITIKQLKKYAEGMFGNLVKAVVDIKKEIMVVDANLHADEEGLLIENGSKQENLWGINLYPFEEDEEFIEFDSMINVRPRQNNRTRGVDDKKTREKIIKIVNKLVQK